MDLTYTIIFAAIWITLGIGHVVLSWRNDGSPYRDPYFTRGSATVCILLMILLWPVCWFGDE